VQVRGLLELLLAGLQLELVFDRDDLDRLVVLEALEHERHDERVVELEGDPVEVLQPRALLAPLLLLLLGFLQLHERAGGALGRPELRLHDVLGVVDVEASGSQHELAAVAVDGPGGFVESVPITDLVDGLGGVHGGDELRRAQTS
jgi:hypothetical protein